MLKQAVEKGTDGMNDYLKKYHMQNNLREELSPPMGETGAAFSSESKPVDNRVIDEQLPCGQIQSQSFSSSAQLSVGTESVVTLSSVPYIAPEVGIGSSAFIALRESYSLVSSVTRHSPYLTTTQNIQPQL